MLPISSLPPQNSEYQNVHVTCMNDQDGVKLVIGTKAFNGLITSSLRIDSIVKPDIGPSTTHFTVYPSSSAKNTRIFLSRKSLEEAKRLARDTKAIRIKPYDILSQLRQVRTQFDNLSTYLCCRASSPQTDDMSCRPYTVFTLADYDNDRSDSNGRIGSILFQTIALSIIRDDNLDSVGENIGCLEKSTVQASENKCKENSKIESILHSIVELYATDDQRIPVIGNSKLNTLLQSLATELAPYITQANHSVAKAILHRYSTSN